MPRYYRTAAEHGLDLHLRPGFTAQVIGNSVLVQHPGGFTCSILKLQALDERPSTEELFRRTELRRWEMFSAWVSK